MKFFFSAVLSVMLILSVSAQTSLRLDTLEQVEINGIQQVISVKGKKGKPLMLFLHGGPGRSLMPFADGFTDKLQEHFIVIQWDQRETGQTLALNSSKEKITAELLKRDAYDMLKYLLQRFDQPKLYLVSHSWGSITGFDLAQKHPELIYAYLPISPMIDAERGAAMTVSLLKEWAMETKNAAATKELNTIQVPFRTQEDLYFSQKWLFIHNEVEGVEGEAFRKTFYAWMAIWLDVWKSEAPNNLFKTTPAVGCPLYFIGGVGDNQTFFKLAKEYYAFVKAPEKKIIAMEKSGHTIFNSEPEKLQEEIIALCVAKEKK